jgi:hypothetical protein
MPKSLQYPWKAPLVNWDPLSMMIQFGTLNPHFDHWGCFGPLGELVDGDLHESVPSDGTGKWSHNVQPPHSEGP